MSKGEATRLSILDSAMGYVSQYGLASISIGKVATLTNMSRTGVISHFQNKSDMQIAILRYCEAVFIKDVLKPAYSPDPATHLKQHFEGWMNWVFKLKQQRGMSCPFVKAIAEFQDQPESNVKQVIIEQQQRSLVYLASIAQRGVEQKQFIENLDCHEFAVESLGYYMAHNISRYLLNDSQADARFLNQVNQLISKSMKQESV